MQEFGWEVFNHHPPYILDLASSDFNLFLQLKKFLSGHRQHFQNLREAEMSVIVVPIPGGRFLRQDKSWSHGMTNVSIPEVKIVSTPVVSWLSHSPVDPRFAGLNPTGVDGLFNSVKILSMTSFGREVKLCVFCCRFMAHKRTSSQN